MVGREKPTSEIIRKRQLQFTGHCIRMDENEPAHIYALYTSIDPAKRSSGYVSQISSYMSRDKQIKFSAEEIVKLAKVKSSWNCVVEPKKPGR